MHWLQPTTHHPETSTRNEVHDLDGFYASIHALLGPKRGMTGRETDPGDQGLTEIRIGHFL